MVASHGGARPGAGRKSKTKADTAAADTPKTRYSDALGYLEAVVRGDEPADGLRIAAAKAVLPFQAPKARAPVESPPPRALRAATARTTDAAEADSWQRREAEVRRRLGREKMQ